MTAATVRLDAVDALLAEIERSGYGPGVGPAHTPIRELAAQARSLLKEERDER